jgi:hypothetical protein
VCDVTAEPAMCRALSDLNKRVRWRAKESGCDETFKGDKIIDTKKKTLWLRFFMNRTSLLRLGQSVDASHDEVD